VRQFLLSSVQKYSWRSAGNSIIEVDGAGPAHDPDLCTRSVTLIHVVAKQPTLHSVCGAVQRPRRLWPIFADSVTAAEQRAVIQQLLCAANSCGNRCNRRRHQPTNACIMRGIIERERSPNIITAIIVYRVVQKVWTRRSFDCKFVKFEQIIKILSLLGRERNENALFASHYLCCCTTLCNF